MAVVGLDQAAHFLGQRYGDDLEPGSVAELGGGDWSRAYGFRVDGTDLVARFGRYGEDYERDRAAMAFAGPDLPVPAVLEIGAALGGAYAISERRFGSFPEQLAEADARRVLPALLRGLDAMRAVPVAPDAPAGWGPANEQHPPTWRDFLVGSLVDVPGARVSGWRATLAADPALDALYLAAEADFRAVLHHCPELRHVLHLDLLNRNVLVDAAAGSLVGVFDWGCSTLGDPVYELAWFTFWAPWHPGLAALDLRSTFEDHLVAAEFDCTDLAERLRGYELHIALTHLAYCAFAPGREQDLVDVAARTRQLMAG